MNRDLFFSVVPDPIGQALGTGFNKFVSKFFVEGLMKETPPGQIELLAVVSTFPGQGHFGEFIKALKKHYLTICVWFDDNPILGPMLARYDFQPTVDLDGRGEPLIGWRWDKEKS